MVVQEYLATLAIPLLVQLFEEQESLNKIETFISKNGRVFYSIDEQKERVRYIKRANPIDSIKYVKTNEGEIKVFNPYKELYWEREN